MCVAPPLSPKAPFAMPEMPGILNPIENRESTSNANVCLFLVSISTDGRDTSKKRTTLARLLRGLKTVNRRDRSNQNNGTGSAPNAGTATQARVSFLMFSLSVSILCVGEQQEEEDEKEVVLCGMLIFRGFVLSLEKIV